MFDIGYASDQGSRDNQEDSLGFRHYADGSVLAVLADGMGGHAGGEVASEWVVKIFGEYFPQTRGEVATRLMQTLQYTNQQLCRRAEASRELQSMGSTLVAVFVQANTLHWLSVGDSLLYRVNAGQLLKLNAAHTLEERFKGLLAAGRIAQAEYDAMEEPHALTSALGLNKLHEIDCKSSVFLSSDTLVLASDGLLSVDEASVARLLNAAKGDSAQMIADKLLQAVLAKGRASQDNIGLIVIQAQPQKALGWAGLSAVLGVSLVLAATGGLGYLWYDSHQRAMLAQAEVMQVNQALALAQQKAAAEANAKQQIEQQRQSAEAEVTKALAERNKALQKNTQLKEDLGKANEKAKKAQAAAAAEKAKQQEAENQAPSKQQPQQTDNHPAKPEAKAVTPPAPKVVLPELPEP